MTFNFEGYQLIDLTHTITDDTPYWDGSCGFELKIAFDYEDESLVDVQFRLNEFSMKAGIGTHIDAPNHCFPGSEDIADISLSRLIAPCYMIDVSDRANADYLISVKDIQDFERNYQTAYSVPFRQVIPFLFAH